MGTPLGPKYIPYTYMEPLEKGITKDHCRANLGRWVLHSCLRGGVVGIPLVPSLYGPCSSEGADLQSKHSEIYSNLVHSILDLRWRDVHTVHAG